MKRTLIALALVGFGVSAPALAGPLEDQFYAMDTSRDGTITRQEFVAYHKTTGATERQANFVFDNTAGGDDELTLSEFRAGPQARTSTRTRTRTRSSTETATRSRQSTNNRRRPSGGGGSFGGGGGS